MTGRAPAIEQVGGAQHGKAIIILNPVSPPMIMRDTVFCAIPADADPSAITESIHARVAEVRRYIPGYTLRANLLFDAPRDIWNGMARVAIFLEVRGNPHPERVVGSRPRLHRYLGEAPSSELPFGRADLAGV